MTTLPPPPKKPGSPGLVPPATDFDEDAPTSVVPRKKPADDMPKEFDEGGELDELPVIHDPDHDDEDATTDGGISRKSVDDEPDEDNTPTRR
jgi:hypothetical protein